MRAQISKKRLDAALSALVGIIPARSSNPLLTSVKVTADTRGLYLTGTNLELDLELHAPGEVDSPASFVVPAHLFAQIVRSMGGELLELELAERSSELSVRGAGSNFKLQTGDVAAYPELSFTQEVHAQVTAGDLARAITGVRYAASNEAFQAVFRGLLMKFTPGSVRMVGSDGFRLGVYDLPLPDSAATRTLILPARNADELLRVFGKGSGEARLSLAFSEGLLSVAGEGARLNAKLLDGDFPDYNRVIPRDTRLSATLPCAALTEAVTRVAILADKNANNRVEMTIQGGQMQLSAEGDYGRAQDTLSCTQEGADSAISLGFNARYLLDALKNVVGDVCLEFTSSTAPVKISPTGDKGLLAVVVPLRV